MTAHRWSPAQAFSSNMQTFVCKAPHNACPDFINLDSTLPFTWDGMSDNPVSLLPSSRRYATFCFKAVVNLNLFSKTSDPSGASIMVELSNRSRLLRPWANASCKASWGKTAMLHSQRSVQRLHAPQTWCASRRHSEHCCNARAWQLVKESLSDPPSLPGLPNPWVWAGAIAQK